MTPVKTRKKLIEVALPLEAINEEGSRRKRKAPAGYPTALHKWWAQRPVAAARAVVFAQLVDDPSSCPDLFPTEKAQEKERQRLFRIMADFVKWENTTNELVLDRARDAVWTSWRRACTDNADHPLSSELFNRHRLPSFLDPFAGSGAIPLEAQRLGLEVHASDLNPVAVLINKAMVEIPPLFDGQSPINPSVDPHRVWKHAEGLADDVRYYGRSILAEASKKIGHLYPPMEISPETALERPDLAPYVGQSLNPVAWLWARTVRSPNPAFSNVQVPLASTFLLSSKAGKEAWIEPIIDENSYKFVVRIGKPKNNSVKDGTKLSRGANFRCVMSGIPISPDYVKSEGKAGRMGARLMAVVAEGDRGRLYLSPSSKHEELALGVIADWKPDTLLAGDLRALWTPLYGLAEFGDLFSPRQLVSINTFSELIIKNIEMVRKEAVAAGLPDDNRHLKDGGRGALSYAEAVAVYLAFALDRVIDFSSTIATWRPKDGAMRSSLAKQAIPMSWDYAEGSPFGQSSAGFSKCVDVVASVLELIGNSSAGFAYQRDACAPVGEGLKYTVKSTDPPYYDNVGYADLSDFFYVWMRKTLRNVYPEMFATLAVPKADELVATPYRHGGKEQAQRFFLTGMTEAMRRLAQEAHPIFPITIYYAFKQSETESDVGTSSTGWEVFLAAVISAGFSINGTWPMRTEGDNRQVGIGANALASSVVLVCRPRSVDAATVTRREFISALKAELPGALRRLQSENIAPVDLAQAAIGPGMAVYSRYEKVLDAQGESVTVHDALTLINEVLDEVLAEQEGDFDAESRWALAWFEQLGFSDGDYGTAELLSKAKNTSIGGLVDAGVLESRRGKVRLLRPDELPVDWDPLNDLRLTAWESVHHLVRALSEGGEAAAAKLVSRLGARAEAARELAYRLYVIAAERRKKAVEALPYNALVQSWPEIIRLAAEGSAIERPIQGALFEGTEV
jgi:putative DNA methylase